ncbi:MAG TPA: hypothetical protein VHI13_13600 [Candidatus Kapabacteria bacterium]|nr:hypothetical protein [Candidatus Kapabacteria bacterium]
MTIRKLFASAAALALMPLSLLTAQTRMEKVVVAEGGGRASSATTAFDGTIGQEATDRASSGSTVGQFGFWNVAVAPASAPLVAGLDATGTMAVAPNPLMERAAISIAVTASSDMEVTLYDLTGRRVATLFAGTVHPGTLVVPVDGRSFAAGRYYVAASANGLLMEQPVTIIH